MAIDKRQQDRIRLKVSKGEIDPWVHENALPCIEIKRLCTLAVGSVDVQAPILADQELTATIMPVMATRRTGRDVVDEKYTADNKRNQRVDFDDKELPTIIPSTKILPDGKIVEVT